MPGNCSTESSFGGFPSRKAYVPHVSLANLLLGGGTPCWRLVRGAEDAMFVQMLSLYAAKLAIYSIASKFFFHFGPIFPLKRLRT